MLSMKAKYAIRALMALARNEGKMLSSKAIAREAEAPVKFLESILLELKNDGLVASKRGISGGYFLTRSPREIMLGEIIRNIDGMLAPIPCASVKSYESCEDCADEDSCAIRHAMIEVRNAIAGILDQKTLAQMLKNEAMIKEEEALYGKPFH